MTLVSRPVLQYHGGKWRLAPWIISHFPKHSIYVEPFGGAASVLLRKRPVAQEVYNDKDGEVVNFFRVLRDQQLAAKLTNLLDFTPFSRVEYDLAHSPSEDVVEQARRTLIKSFMGYGSNAISAQYKTGFRHRRYGSGPPVEWANYPAHVQSFVERLKNVSIENIDAATIMQTYDTPETLFYIDPPYVMETRGTHGASYKFEMDNAAHEDLARLVRSLQGKAVVSGYDCPLYHRFYAGWHCERINALADGAAKRTECLWISPNAKRSMGLQMSFLEVV